MSDGQSTRTIGHCLCRACRFSYEGAPLWVGHCHCESCRRQTSSAFATFVGLASSQLRHEGVTPAIYESSSGVHRSFCPRCGSPIAYSSERHFPGEVHIYLGTLVDPGSVTPSFHVHTAEQVPWFEVLDDLPRFHGSGRGQKPVRRGPRNGGTGP